MRRCVLHLFSLLRNQAPRMYSPSDLRHKFLESPLSFPTTPTYTPKGRYSRYQVTKELANVLSHNF